MGQDLIPDEVQSRYDGAWLRGPRITRLEETRLDFFRLNAETAWQLGKDNIGVFVGACPPLGPIIDILRRLEHPTFPGRWVIVAATKLLAEEIAKLWFAVEPRKRKNAVLKLPILRQNIILATPESLRRIGSDNQGNIAGIIVVDTLCRLHLARGDEGMTNDRPQRIVDFRNAVGLAGWLPPLILTTPTAAKSTTTDGIARAYCIDAWWYVDGKSLRCGPPPATAQVEPISGDCSGSEAIAPEAIDRIVRGTEEAP